MADAPPLPPPAIEQPAPYQVSYGLVTGRAARGTTQVVVLANGRKLAARPLRGRRFSLRVALPVGDATVRVVTSGRGGRRSSAHVHDVFGLPAAGRPRRVASRVDPVLARKLRGLAREYSGTPGYYVQSLTGGSGAAWNAKARFPAASTVKLAIAAAVLASHSGIPPPGSRVGALLREMIVPSDDEAANALLVWLAGSTSSGGQRVNALMESIGLTDTLMYGGYETRALSGPIPARVNDAPAFGVGKYTTAWDMTSALARALARVGRLGSASLGPARPDTGRRAPLAVADGTRTRSPEARQRHPRSARRRGAAQGRLDLDGAPRHGSRLLGRGRLRRGRHDVEAERSRPRVGSSRGEGCSRHPRARPPYRRLTGSGGDLDLSRYSF